MSGICLIEGCSVFEGEGILRRYATLGLGAGYHGLKARGYESFLANARGTIS
jgi:hypothetical protein